MFADSGITAYPPTKMTIEEAHQILERMYPYALSYSVCVFKGGDCVATVTLGTGYFFAYGATLERAVENLFNQVCSSTSPQI